MRKIKNVDVKQCVGALIFVLVAFCTVLIPFLFEGPDFAFNHLPLVGDGDIIPMLDTYTNAFFKVINIQTPLIMTYVSNYCLYVFYGILAFDLLFCLFLIIIRCNGIRIFCKIISILAGILMFALTFVFLFYVVGFIINISQNITPEMDILSLIQQGGLIYLFSLFIFSFLLISKQFKWFRRYY